MTATKSTHVLLVEDTLTQALMMQHLLESQQLVETQQFKVSVAKDGNKALAFLASEKPDLILSDISMPEIDGYQLCQRVKENSDTCEIPFVLLSSFHDATEIANVVNSGADSFMLKRFDQKYVIDGLNDVLADCNEQKSKGDKGQFPRTQVKVNHQGIEYSVAGDAPTLATMVFSAFRTIVHLIPLVQEE